MKNRMNLKRVFSLFALAAILVSMFAFTSCTNTKSPDEAKGSVVAIENIDGTGQGSGFAIGKPGKPVSYFVTNYHVVDCPGISTNFAAIIHLNSNTNSSIRARIFAFDEDRDIAILALDSPIDAREALTLCPEEYVKAGEESFALGFPTGDIVNMLASYNVSNVDVKRGGVSNRVLSEGYTNKNNTRSVFHITNDIHAGNSGGPLINSKGQVIGINTFSTAVYSTEGNPLDEVKNNYAVSSYELINFLEEERILDQVSVYGGFPWLMAIIIGAAVLVVIIILILVLALRKKPAANNPAASAGNPTVALDPGYATPAQSTGARIIVIGGVLNGKKYNLSGTVRIGRDASRCAIAYPVSTQGVSGLHCEVTFDGNVCYLKDLGSSYGTYTGTGVKLTKDVPVMLRSGDKFYLASPENTFEIRF